jgi:hypothetical protein
MASPIETRYGSYTVEIQPAGVTAEGGSALDDQTTVTVAAIERTTRRTFTRNYGSKALLEIIVGEFPLNPDLLNYIHKGNNAVLRFTSTNATLSWNVTLINPCTLTLTLPMEDEVSDSEYAIHTSVSTARENSLLRKKVPKRDENIVDSTNVWWGAYERVYRHPTIPDPMIKKSYVDAKGGEITRDHLANTELQGLDLQGMDLRDIDLSGKDMTRTNLYGACLRGAKLVGTIFELADLRGVDMRDSDLRGAAFAYARANGINLSNVVVDGKTNFTRCDLRGAKLCRVDLSIANLAGCKINWSRTSVMHPSKIQ